MDFLLKDEGIIIEVKKTRKGSSAREIEEQLLKDIERYREHPDCKILFCFVYDPKGKILNPNGLEKDLARETGGLRVRVLVVPKGY
ncbi:MAG: hypothetical protein AYK18_01590 [Theionarchaea archaeon DG-70]|nr:MAG: hypothetical protein AYK18_01590 [Theionarchaea archaeon DG-70]